MLHENAKKEAGNAARADVMKEMSMPRMARSARIAELKLDPTRIPERPDATMAGTVDKIISSPRPSQVEKVQIAIDGAGRGHRHLRIENTLTDEDGDDVRLKKGADVEVTITADPRR